MTQQRLEALERLCEEATEGPWDGYRALSIHQVEQNNQRFIAAARTEVPWLIAQLGEAWAALERLAQ